ncbi:MAG TPA: response regulator [Dehalococcoidia bacterium]|nr:response regulator [Dehalococcoidia bacterium]
MARQLILVADDDAPTRRWLRLILEQDGYAVVEAASGRQALAAVAAHSPCLLLLDLNMPDMNGLQVCAALVRRRLTIPVLLLTAQRLPPATIAGQRAFIYLRKPVDEDRLLAEVARLVA